jgi:hypothetical protein
MKEHRGRILDPETEGAMTLNDMREKAIQMMMKRFH